MLAAVNGRLEGSRWEHEVWQLQILVGAVPTAARDQRSVYVISGVYPIYL